MDIKIGNNNIMQNVNITKPLRLYKVSNGIPHTGNYYMEVLVTATDATSAIKIAEKYFKDEDNISTSYCSLFLAEDINKEQVIQIFPKNNSCYVSIVKNK